MPTVSPFRALRYAPALRRDLDRLIAPPYDVLSETERDRLAGLHPNQIVHLDLPRPGPGRDPYAASAVLLAEFIRGGALQRDERPAFYALEQTFRTPSGQESVRRGFFARLRLEPLDGGVVIPHERTLDQPRADRQRLLSSTRTHLSAVFLLHPDPEGEVAGLIERSFAGKPFDQARDDEGTVSRLVSIDGGAEIATLSQRLESSWALIADGHHRYESALAYRDGRRAAGSRDAEHVLAFFCSLGDHGLRIFPIHRLVHSLSGFAPAAFLASLQEVFSLTAVEGGEALRLALASRRGRPGVFGFLFPGGDHFLLAEWKEGAGLDRPELASIPDPLRRLDVILLHRLILEGVLGITAEAQARQSNLEYVKNDRELVRRVRDGRVQIGILMNPTRIEQVVDVTRRGLRLPQKSTYFYPKVPTGFVLDPLDP